ETAQRRAGVPPAQRAPQREREEISSVGFAADARLNPSSGAVLRRLEAFPIFRFLEINRAIQIPSVCPRPAASQPYYPSAVIRPQNAMRIRSTAPTPCDAKSAFFTTSKKGVKWIATWFPGAGIRGQKSAS